MRTPRTTTAALFLVLALAGCANNVSSAESGASSAPSASVSAVPSADASARPTSPPIAKGTEKITGTVAEGVEPNCLVLQDDTGSHVLIFGDAALRSAAKVGSKITALGRSNPKQMTTCQQGVPFLVTSVTAG